MEEKYYYEEIEHLIKHNEISKRVRKLEENRSLVETYWQIGKIIVEAQGGSKRAKYGNKFIKKWSNKFTELYGKGYDATNLRKFRQFYLCYPKCAPLGLGLTWSHYRELLPIKDENKRELIKELKSNSYERLIDKPNKMNITIPTKSSITTDVKNPIIIPIQNEVISEHDLELNILANLDFFFKQLGNGFAYIAHQYKLIKDNHNYFIDLLLFNYKFNSFIVVELKLRSLKKEDKAQMEFYMKLVDEQVKEVHHNKTMGIIITKESNEFIVNFVHQEDIIPLNYKFEKIMESN